MISKVLNLKILAITALMFVLGFTSKNATAQMCEAGIMSTNGNPFACVGGNISANTFNFVTTAGQQLYYVAHSGVTTLGTVHAVNTTGVFTNDGTIPQGQDVYISAFVGSSSDPTLACDIVLPGQIGRFYEPVQVNVLQNSCNSTTGVASVSLSLSGGAPDFPGSSFQYTVDGTIVGGGSAFAQQTLSSGQVYSFFTTNTNQVQITVQNDGKGCNGSLLLDVNCSECTNFAGVAQPAQFICSDDPSFTAIATNTNADAGNTIFHVLHDNASMVGNIVDFNTIGTFASALLTPNVQYYVSTVVGVAGPGNTLPDLTDDCTQVLLPGSPVVLLEEIEINAMQSCDPVSGITTVNFTVQGGLNAFNGTTYTASGNFNGTILANQTYSFNETGTGTFVITVIDNAGCEFTASQFYNCDGCNNFSGTTTTVLQNICAGDGGAIATVNDAVIDPNSQLVYVLHNGFNSLGNVVDFNSTGIFPLATNYPTNTPLYITPIVGEIASGEDFADVTDPCTSAVFPGVPVLFVPPIALALEVDCEITTGNAEICITASGGDNGAFSVQGDIVGNVAQNAQICGTFSDLLGNNDGNVVATFVNSGSGCVSTINENYTCVGCNNFAGNPNLPVILCDGEVANGNVQSLDPNDQPFSDDSSDCVCVLQDGQFTVGTIYAFNDTGLFPHDISIPTNTQLYMSWICGVIQPNGLPDPNDGCTDVMLPGSPVTYLDPIVIDTDLTCDDVSGTSTILYTVEGGLPAFNTTFFTVTGTNPEIVQNAAINTFTIPTGMGNVVIEIDDENGCEAATSFAYNCDDCNNNTGFNPPSQTACWGQNINAATTGSFIEPGSNQIYILTDNPNFPMGGGTVLDFNSTGIFNNNTTLNTGVSLYVVSSIGVILPGGLTDPNDPCTVYSAPISVSLFDPITITDSFICDDVTGVVTVTYAVNGGAPQFNFPSSSLTYTITGGFDNGVTSPNVPNTFNVAQSASGGTYQIIVSDINGCTGAITQPYICTGCLNTTGTPQPSQTVCAGSSANGFVSNPGNVQAGESRVYILHDGFGTIGNPIDFNTTGVFQNTGSNTNQQLYITEAIGPLGANGMPDDTDPCTVYGFPGTPVVFLNPITITTNFTCDEVNGTATVSYLVSGGLPAFNPSTVYTVNENGTNIATITNIGSGVFNLPISQNGNFTINVSDGNSCSATLTDSYTCLQCMNDAGFPGSAEIICAGETFNCSSTTAIADPGSVIQYIIHDGATQVGNNIEAFNFTGIFSNVGQFPYGVQLYCSPAVGMVDPISGLIDLTDPCADILLPGTPVTFLSPVIINETVTCNDITGNTAVDLVVTGGSETNYTVTCSQGSFNGNAFFNVPENFILPAGQATITCDAVDAAGCVGTQTFSYNCTGCVNEAGTMPQLTQTVCFLDCVTSVSSGFVVDPANAATELVYVLHTGTTGITGIISTNTTGEFCHDNTIPALVTGTTYYISAVVAEVINGQPDFTDPCFDAALPGTPVIFSQPTAVLVEGECDMIAGTYEVCFTVTDGPTGFFAVTGDYTGFANLNQQICFTDDGDNTINLEFEDASGCIEQILTTYNCDGCPPANAGVMPSTPLYACANETFTAGPPFALDIADPEAFICYYMHTNEFDVANSAIATSSTGVFANTGLDYYHNVQLYVTAVVGPLAFGQSCPDPTDPCAELSNAQPVGLLAPVVIEDEWNCDANIGEFNVIFTVTGGLPSFPGTGALYNYSGDEVGLTAANTQVAIGPYGDGAIYNIDVVDSEGCMASFQSLPIQCEKLPIELTYFEGEVQKAGNYLTWETASEFENDFYKLFRSNDEGNTFNEIAIIEAVGNSTTRVAYNYLDNNAPNGESIYKLVDVSTDGAENEARDKVILNRSNTLFTINDLYPNPVSDVLFVEVEADINDKFEVAVYNHLGKQVINQVYNANGNISNIEINTNNLAAGTYIVSITNNNITLTERFIKQ